MFSPRCNLDSKDFFMVEFERVEGLADGFGVEFFHGSQAGEVALEVVALASHAGLAVADDPMAVLFPSGNAMADLKLSGTQGEDGGLVCPGVHNYTGGCWVNWLLYQECPLTSRSVGAAFVLPALPLVLRHSPFRAARRSERGSVERVATAGRRLESVFHRWHSMTRHPHHCGGGE
jgi:hypothetical protein